jgi:hypothetical protein
VKAVLAALIALTPSVGAVASPRRGDYKGTARQPFLTATQAQHLQAVKSAPVTQPSATKRVGFLSGRSWGSRTALASLLGAVPGPDGVAYSVTRRVED